MEYRRATLGDAGLLARMNGQLIMDEGNRNPMSLAELEGRMAGWLAGEYSAVIFVYGDEAAGYALFRKEADHIYLRHFFVRRDLRRRGIGRAAFAWLRDNAWPRAVRLRLDVLVGNTVALAFWHSLGFSDYCLTMEQAGTSGARSST